MLIDYGCSPVNADWQVNEKTACGFVRVYDIYEGEVFCREGASEPGEEILLRPGSVCLFPSAAPYFLRQNPQNRLFCTHLHLDIAPALLRRTLTLEAPQGSIVRGIFDALRAAVCGGAGGDYLEEAAALGCDCYITGDVRHHEFLEARRRGILLMDAGHHATENIAMAQLRGQLAEALPGVEVLLF